MFCCLVANLFVYLLQSGLPKVDDQLDRVIEQVCRDSDTPLPVSTLIRQSVGQSVSR